MNVTHDREGFPNPDPIHPVGEWFEDERVPSWEDQRRLATEPRRFDVMGCLGCAVVVLITIAGVLLVLAGLALIFGAWQIFGTWHP